MNGLWDNPKKKYSRVFLSVSNLDVPMIDCEFSVSDIWRLSIAEDLEATLWVSFYLCFLINWVGFPFNLHRRHHNPQCYDRLDQDLSFSTRFVHNSQLQTHEPSIFFYVLFLVFFSQTLFMSLCKTTLVKCFVYSFFFSCSDKKILSFLWIAEK